MCRLPGPQARRRQSTKLDMKLVALRAKKSCSQESLSETWRGTPERRSAIAPEHCRRFSSKLHFCRVHAPLHIGRATCAERKNLRLCRKVLKSRLFLHAICKPITPADQTAGAGRLFPFTDSRVRS